MKINKVKIQHLGKLARLSFNSSEMSNMVDDLKEILKFVNKLDEINTNNIKPLTHLHNKTNITREDIVVKSDFKKSILENAPIHNSDYIKVPKVVGKKK